MPGMWGMYGWDHVPVADSTTSALMWMERGGAESVLFPGSSTVRISGAGEDSPAGEESPAGRGEESLTAVTCAGRMMGSSKVSS